jgi:hypothetical protein
LSACASRASRKYGALSMFGVGMGTMSVCIVEKTEPEDIRFEELDSVGDMCEAEGVRLEFTDRL